MRIASRRVGKARVSVRYTEGPSIGDRIGAMSESTSSFESELGNEEPLAGPPRWVKVVAAVVAAALLIATILVVTGGPEAHGPGRHGAGPPLIPAAGFGSAR